MRTSTLGQAAARSVWKIFPTRAYSGLIGRVARRDWGGVVGPAILKRFVKAFSIDMSEAEKPLTEYQTVGELFTRRLRQGARPVDPAEDSIVAPSDGRVVACGHTSPEGRVRAKGIDFLLQDLLADAAAADELLGGAFAVIYLSPQDYHRVHTPAAGAVTGFRHIPGSLLSVNDASVAREPALFSQNERLVTFMEGAPGKFAVVMVAAVGVGHITTTYDPGITTHGPGQKIRSVKSVDYARPCPLGKGEELGIFHLGSTAIILFQKGRVELDRAHAGQVARMGAQLGRIL